MPMLIARGNRKAASCRATQLRRHHSRRLLLERLEDRRVMALLPNDPDFETVQWGLNNVGQNGGIYDVDIDAPEAWSITTGSMATVLALIDDGADFTHADIYLNIWLNQGEIPSATRAALTDTDGDDLITFRDLNQPANAASVSDLNATGYIDGGDLLADSRWADGGDNEGNGKVDDLVGWDSLDNDNDPRPAAGFGHGTGMVQWIGAIPNNGIGKAGVNRYVSVMPIRARLGNETEISAQAVGLDYAVENSAPIAAVWGGGPTFSQPLYEALDRARIAGTLVTVPAGNVSTDLDASPNYPPSYDSDNLIVVTSFNARDGKDDVWNWGATTVDLAGPTAPGGGTSGGNAHVAAVAALLKSIHPGWNYQQLKDRILSTVEPSAALAGKTVTGGRLNAAQALSDTSISISDPIVYEGASGTQVVSLDVTRFGDDGDTVVVNWATANGTATAGSDYTSAAGQLVFSPGGPNLQSISVSISGDTANEGNEGFFVTLTLQSGDALLADSAAQVAILNDDVPISIVDATAVEGASTPHYRGAFVADGVTSGGHFNPLTFGPDGNLYTAVGTGAGYNSIRRYSGSTGELMGTFVPQGKINGVRDMVFRNGLLYVASAYTNEVLRYDATTGAYVDTFVAAGSGGIQHPNGMLFGPDSNSDGVPELYVSGTISDSVVRYDGVTGLPLGTFITTGSGGLVDPFAFTFGPGGVYVTSAGTNRILKYNSQTGAYLGVAASTGLSFPEDVEFGPDGLMYVASGSNDRILRFTSAGAYVDDFVPAAAGGLDNPTSLAFGPDNNLYVTATGNDEILRFGTESEIVFTVSLSIASTVPVSVNYSTSGGSAAPEIDFTSTSGTITFLPGVTTRHIRVPLLDDAVYEGNEQFAVNLSNAVGSAIADGQGTGTIIDDDVPPTKFYVVDDATANKTFEYAASGTAIENYSLLPISTLANTAPRGAASTTAGDRVWVVDANKHVYVYDTAGNNIDLWRAYSLANNAQVEGIAVHGTTVWIVDAKSDKVFRYNNATGPMAPSQNAASSFNLASGNGAPTDLVTDGTHIWVLNNAAQDKVFKYTVSGTLVGSWTLTGGGGSPTGITLDPASPSHLWIVDSSTDRVYQYNNAVGRTSGSQAAASSFALAAGNTNPQGIADPPPPAAFEPISTPERTASANHENDQALMSIVAELAFLDGRLGKKRR